MTMFTREIRTPGSDGLERLPRIYCFPNARSGDWIPCYAMAEDGRMLASHVCSHPEWGRHDLGMTSDWKHDRYLDRYPAGFVLVWIDDASAPDVPDEFARAVKLNRELGEAARASKEASP